MPNARPGSFGSRVFSVSRPLLPDAARDLASGGRPQRAVARAGTRSGPSSVSSVDVRRLHRAHDRVGEPVARGGRRGAVRSASRRRRRKPRRSTPTPASSSSCTAEVLAAQGEPRLRAAARHRHRRLARARLALEDPPVVLDALGERRRRRARPRAPRASGASFVHTLTRPRKPGGPSDASDGVDLGHRREQVAHLGALQREARGRPAGGHRPPRAASRRAATPARTGPAVGDLDSGRLAQRGERLVERRARHLDARRGRRRPRRRRSRRRRAAASAWNTSARSTSRRRSVSGPRPGSFAVGARPCTHDRPRRVAVDAARRGVLLERVVDGHRQLGVGARDRAAAVCLEAVAGALLRHQEVGDAEEAALEPALERAQRALADARARGS